MLFHNSWHSGGHRSSTVNSCPALKYPHLHLLSVIVSFTFAISFISVAGLYDPFGIQYTVLQQVFRQMYGMTVYEYRTQVRMQEAKNLLLAGSLTVTEIAGRCGYTNASKFAAGFRRIAGMPPGEWRRRMKH